MHIPKIVFSILLATWCKILGHFSVDHRHCGGIEEALHTLAPDPHTGMGVISGIISSNNNNSKNSSRNKVGHPELVQSYSPSVEIKPPLLFLATVSKHLHTEASVDSEAKLQANAAGKGPHPQ